MKPKIYTRHLLIKAGRDLTSDLSALADEGQTGIVGLNIEETAGLLDISPATVKRE